MNLKILMGGAGSGKTTTVYETMISESQKHPERDYILLVPEQFTMEAQKDLIQMHPRHGLLNIDIQSFIRLAYRVFDELNMREKNVLDDTGKNLILRKILAEQKENLQVFAKKTGMQGFVSEMKSVLSEFEQYGIGVEQMDALEIQTKSHPLLYRKLKDVRLVSEHFFEFLGREYVTSEGLLELFLRVMERSEIIKNATFVLDGFTGFTPIQYRLIEQLLRLSKEVVVVVTLPEKEAKEPFREQELFAMSKKMVQKLKRIAEDCNLGTVPCVYEEKIRKHEGRFANAGALSHLQEHFFRTRTKVYTNQTDDISITACKNPFEEMAFVVNEIQNLVAKGGYRYREIAVVTADMEGYYRAAEKLLQENRIPAFIDHKRSVLNNPAVECVRSIIEIARQDFTYESIFRFLKTGMYPMPYEEMDKLENYLIAMGIRGYRIWNEGFLYSGQVLSADDPHVVLQRGVVTEEELRVLNETREQFMETVGREIFCLREKNLTVKKMTEILYRIVEKLHMNDTLMQLQETFEQNGELSKSREYKQTYEYVIELFDEVVSLMGTEQIPLEEYGQILDAGFQEIKVGVIPPGLDQIVVGDMERTRLNDIKVLFFAGINDGNIPKRMGSRGILTESEREFLKTCNLELSPTAKENSFIERYYLYLNMTKPAKKLYLSYSKTGNDGKQIRPSYILDTIRSMFPNLMESSYVHEKNLSGVTNLHGAWHFIAEQMQEFGTCEETDAWKEVLSYLLKHGNEKQIQILADGAFGIKRENLLDREVANELYGNVDGSISRLEKYAACAYSHFLNYGLKLMERKEHQVEAADLGNMYHGALDYISNEIKNRGLSWKALDDAVTGELIEDAVKVVGTQFKETAINSSARNRYLLSKLKQVTKRTVWAIASQLKHGDFEPYATEFSIWNGRVDRVDLYETDDTVYVKIVDYKTGKKEFFLDEIYEGLQIQLTSYMQSVIDKIQQEKKGKFVCPGAMFYYQIKDPFVSQAVMEDKEMYLKEFMPSGLVSSKTEVIKALDAQAEGGASNVMKVAYKKDGNFTAASSVATPEQFRSLMRFVASKKADLNEEIKEGRIDVNPYKEGQKTPCNYCKYRFICGFDPKLPGNEYRRLMKLKKEELWEKIQEGGEGGSTVDE